MRPTVTPTWDDLVMAFGQASGYPASKKQIQDLTELVVSSGYTGLREARHPLGLTQRQSNGKFTRDEADDLIARLEAAAEVAAFAGESGQHEASDQPALLQVAPPVDPREAEQVAALKKMPVGLLAAELQRRGWIVMEP